MAKQIKTYDFIAGFKHLPHLKALELITVAGTWSGTECMNLKGLNKLTADMPVYAIVDNGEVVVALFDWADTPKAKMAGEDSYPVWVLSVFIHQYKEALAEAGIEQPKMWGLLLTNSIFTDYMEKQQDWEAAGISVYHNLGSKSLPDVHYSRTFHHEALAQIRAFRLWCKNHDFLRSDPYDFDAIDADYDEMEFGLDENENDIYESFDDEVYDSHDDEEKMDLPFPKVNNDLIADTLMLSRNKEGRFTDDIRAVDIEVLFGLEKGCYCPGNVAVTLTGQPKVKLNPNRFGMYVYTDTYYPVCIFCDSITTKRKKGNKMTFVIPCDRIWMPGKYMLLIRDEKKALTARIDFAFDEKMNMTSSCIHECDLLGLESTLISPVSQLEAWIEVAFLPGNIQMRRKVIELQQLALYNALRNEHGEPDIHTCGNFIFYTRNNDITYGTLKDFLKLTAFKKEFAYVDCTSLYDISRTNPYELIPELLGNAQGKVLCLTNLGGLTEASSKVIISKVIALVKVTSGDTLLWLCGTKREIDDAMNLFPTLRQFFQKDSYIEPEAYTAFEIVQSVSMHIRSEGMDATFRAKDLLARSIKEGFERGLLGNWSFEDIARFVTEEIRPRYLKRTLPLMTGDFVPQLNEEDIDTAKIVSPVSAFDEYMKGLNEMVGLNDVKQGIKTMANQARLFAERRRMGLKTSSDMVFHSIFTGNPGTGKTTVARQLGKIYHSLGLLSKGEVISVDRTRLVGQYIGQTEENMKIVLEEARGNVLFVDEAYTLKADAEDQRDFGGRVLDSLLTVLTQPNPDMLIVFAGYTKEMDDMLNTNPGLAGRFPFRYKFEDYSAEELMAIARKMLTRDEYILTHEAELELQKDVADVIRQKTRNFGNARWIEQFVQNGIIPALADRIFSTGSKDVQSIEASDIHKAYEKFNPKATELKSRLRVAGFGIR